MTLAFLAYRKTVSCLVSIFMLFGIQPAGADTWLPTGQFITPEAAPGAKFVRLNPGAVSAPEYAAGQAVTSVLSPDKKTMLVLTAGFNLYADKDGNPDKTVSGEWVFVFDVTNGYPVQKQALQLRSSYCGIVFAPDGQQFFVAGGVDDSVHSFLLSEGRWQEAGAAIGLGHKTGLGSLADPVKPLAAGLAITTDGKTLLVANMYNDSVSLIDVAKKTIRMEIDLRPGKINAADHGKAGGTFPYWIAVAGNSRAYVSAQRDREIVVLDLDSKPHVAERVPVRGIPNRMVLDKAAKHLYVAADNSDLVQVIETDHNRVQQSFSVYAPAARSVGKRPRGVAPDALALSADEKTLYVSNGGENAVAVVDLAHQAPRVTGLIPTGWYPNSVSLSGDEKFLYVINGKSPTGPNPANCKSDDSPSAMLDSKCKKAQRRAGNQYGLQLTKAGLLSLPVPHQAQLQALTKTVLANNGIDQKQTAAAKTLFTALRQRIKHIVYIVKENRTYDQVLGDLAGTNGDPDLAQYPRATTPNFHALAEQFVALDNFYVSGEVSGDGWQWSTGARASDRTIKIIPVNYADKGGSYDVEGGSRNLNVALPTGKARHAANPAESDDDDILAGTHSQAELDGPDDEIGLGYLWDAALRAHKTVRNYGFFLDLTRYSLPPEKFGLAPIENPFTSKTRVAYPAIAALMNRTDPYFRGFDPKLPDYFRYQEWKREFSQQEKAGVMPDLTLVRFMNDHTGEFAAAIRGVNTPELQQADNDYATGLLIERIAHSRFAHNTLICVLEDDAQDGPDHVDSHRSTAYVVGPYVKQHAHISTRYTTLNMLRTIESLMGLPPLNMFDQVAIPMADLFDLKQQHWAYKAAPADMLYGTKLPLPPRVSAGAVPQSSHDAQWWARATKGFDFSREDKVDTTLYNQILWRGLMGDKLYPLN